MVSTPHGLSAVHHGEQLPGGRHRRLWLGRCLLLGIARRTGRLFLNRAGLPVLEIGMEFPLGGLPSPQNAGAVLLFSGGRLHLARQVLSSSFRLGDPSEASQTRAPCQAHDGEYFEKNKTLSFSG